MGTNIFLLLSQVDQQMVLIILGPVAAGYYTSYMSLLLLFNIFLSPLIIFLFPVMSGLVSRGERGKIRALQSILYRILPVFAFGASGFFFVFGPLLSIVFFGAKFAYSGTLLTYSAPFIILSVLLQLNFIILASLGLVRERLSILVYSVIVNIVGNIILIPLLGMVGAVVAMVGAWTILFFGTYRRVSTFEPIILDTPFLLRNLTLATVFFLICFRFEAVFHMTSRIESLLGLFGVIGTYVSLVILLNYSQRKHIHRLFSVKQDE